VQLLMEDARARERMISEFESIIAKVGTGGASEAAAHAIVQELKEQRSPDRRGDLEIALP